MLSIALLILTTGSNAQTGWLDPAWGYRAPVSVSNTGGTALANYQVHVALDSSFHFGHAKSDGSDLRVTAGNGTTLIPYYLETWTAGTSASLWVQVPSVPSGGTTLYVYYGNPNATSASSGDATFD